MAKIPSVYSGLTKSQKRQHAKDNQELVECLAGDYGFDIEMITDFQMRLSLSAGRLDYFPGSGKATWVGSGKWFSIPDIEQFLLKNK